MDLAGTNNIKGPFTIDDTTESTNKDSGALILNGGGLGVERNISSGGVVRAEGGFEGKYSNQALSGGNYILVAKNLAKRIVEIGAWPMDSVAIVTVPTTLTVAQNSKIRNIFCLIKGNDGKLYHLNYFNNGLFNGVDWIDPSAGTIELGRSNGGFFQSSNFSGTGIGNRGWVYIEYEV